MFSRLRLNPFFLKIILDKMTIGRTWQKREGSRPEGKNRIELTNVPELKKALDDGQLEFSQSELEDFFGSSDSTLTMNHFVKTDGGYYQPRLSTPSVIVMLIMGLLVIIFMSIAVWQYLSGNKIIAAGAFVVVLVCILVFVLLGHSII